MLGYYYAEKYNYRLDKWNKTLAYVFFRTAIYNNAKPALFIDADGNTWTISYGPRYYDEAACTVQCFLMFYELGISDALNDALYWWNWINNNLWYEETHFKYGLNWADYECEAGFFAKIIANLRYYTNDLGNWSRVLADLQNRFLIDGWNSKQWFSKSENKTTYVVVHHYPSNSQRRLQNTIGAWVSLFSLFGDLNDSSKITMQNLLKGYLELEPAWRLLMNNAAKLYDNVSNKFRWTSDTSVSDDASAYALTLMFLMGIVPKTAVLAFPIEEYSYEYFYDIDPELYNIDFENKTIHISLLKGGELEFIYGTSTSSFNFPSKGIYTIVFSNDWNTIVNVSKLQDLPNNRKFINPRTTSRTIVVPDDYSTIQEAINNAESGDTIFVRNGTYCENILINKTISLVGENRETTIVDGYNSAVTLEISVDNVTISGFTISHSGGMDYTGLYLVSANNCVIDNNIVENNLNGILLNSSNNNTISSNYIRNNVFDGVYLWNSSCNNVVFNNTVTGHGYYGVIVHNLSNNNSLSENTITENGWGIVIDSSLYNVISKNKIINHTNHAGVWLDYGSSWNKILKNRIENNSVGIDAYLLTGHDNIFHWNSFINNTYHALLYNISNIWDNGCEGNYWSGYNGTDSDGDGIGDTPYVIDENNTDNYPLMNPYIEGDINHDGIVDMTDIGWICFSYAATPSHERWNPHCDLDENKIIDMTDIGYACLNYAKTYQ